MSRKCTVTDPQLGNLRKCRLQCRHQFALKLSVNLFSFIILLYISAHICIEQNRIRNTITIFTKAFDRNVHIQANIGIYYSERYRIWCTIFIAHKFLGVHKIYSLILRCLSTKRKTLANLLKNTLNSSPQISTENRRLCRHIIDIFARLCTNIHNFSLFYDQHALSVIDCDHRSIGNDVFGSMFVGRSSRNFFMCFCNQYIRRHRFTVEIFFPLICHNPTCCSYCRFN